MSGIINIHALMAPVIIGIISAVVITVAVLYEEYFNN